MSDTAAKPPARGRPRRSQQETQEMQARILRAARALFARDGYGGVSMRKLAAAAGCAPAALYAYFPNKRAVLRVLWQDVFAELGADMRAALDTAMRAAAGKTDDPLDKLHVLTAAAIRFWLARPDDYRAIFLIEDAPVEPGGTYFAEESGVRDSLGLLVEAAAEAAALGHLRIRDPQRILALFIGAMNGIALNLITIPEQDWGAPDVLIDDMVTTLITGLRA